jgi:hypothetical protein
MVVKRQKKIQNEKQTLFLPILLSPYALLATFFAPLNLWIKFDIGP